MAKAGMNVVRLNFSHGEKTFFREMVDMVRSVSQEINVPIAIMQDLQGPKIRTKTMENGGVELKTGEICHITTENIVGTAGRFASGYASLVEDVQIGHRILLDDGKIAVRVTDKTATDLVCTIEHGGILKDRKGMNLPDSKVSAPSMTDKDIADAEFGQELGVDAVALSFVRSRHDIRMLRRLLAKGQTRPLVIAKLEKPEAIEQLEGIIDETDGVMVARGDLGVEIPPERVPIIQKKIIEEASRRGRFVIVATQMLESMITDPRPTRAEASDVANAVFDGADCLMLSGETAVGHDPVLVVRTMNNIMEAAEDSEHVVYQRTRKAIETQAARDFQNAISLTAVRAAAALKAKSIVVYSGSGATARLIAQYRPRNRVIVLVPDAGIQQRLALVWGIESVVIPKPATSDDLFESIDNVLIGDGVAKPGDTIVVCTKVPFVDGQRTNTLHLYSPGGARLRLQGHAG